MSGVDPEFADAAAVHESYGGDWVAGDPDDLRRRYDRARAGLAGDAAAGVSAEAFDLGGRAAGLVFRPEGGAAEGGAIIYFHGGSWMVGSPETHRVPCSFLAALTGVPVWSVRYRLAPEHAFPAQREDAVAAVEAVLAVGADRVVLAGDSAGAAVAFWAEAALGTAARGRLAGVAGFYGAYGRLPGREGAGGTESPGLSRPELLAAYGRLGPLEALARMPGFTIEASLPADGPGVFLACGTEDPLLEDTEALAARLRAVGRAVEVDVPEGLPHSYLHYAGRVAAARRAMERAAAWVRGAFGGAPVI